MTTRLQRQVLEFHRVFDHPIADSPTIPADDRVRFRAAFIVEECLEFLEACFVRGGGQSGGDLGTIRELLEDFIRDTAVKVDLPLAVDALADIDYVVEGCRLEFGVNGEPIADEVHRANMTKVGGTRTPEGKTMKPPGWTPPDIAGELEKQKQPGWMLGDEIYGTATPGPYVYDQVNVVPRMSSQQRLDFAYGNLAIDGKASRSAFKILATTTADEGLGWTPEQFEAWAEGKKWSAP